MVNAEPKSTDTAAEPAEPAESPVLERKPAAGCFPALATAAVLHRFTVWPTELPKAACLFKP